MPNTIHLRLGDGRRFTLSEAQEDSSDVGDTIFSGEMPAGSGPEQTDEPQEDAPDDGDPLGEGLLGVEEEDLEDEAESDDGKEDDPDQSGQAVEVVLVPVGQQQADPEEDDSDDGKEDDSNEDTEDDSEQVEVVAVMPQAQGKAQSPGRVQLELVAKADKSSKKEGKAVTVDLSSGPVQGSFFDKVPVGAGKASRQPEYAPKAPPKQRRRRGPGSAWLRRRDKS